MENFISRHIGPRAGELSQMFAAVGVASMDELIGKALPDNIRLPEPLKLPSDTGEPAYLKKLEKLACANKTWRSCIGLGYYNSFLPAVIKRNILENPSWYTSYTPYQAEISQGRLEALLNFQTVITELTGMEIANASLLDESTAAAEAMMMMYHLRSREAVKNGANRLFVDIRLFPQSIDVIRTRALPPGIEVVTGDFASFVPDELTFGAVVQYPDADGVIEDFSGFTGKMHAGGVKVCVIADLLSLALLVPPGKWGADVVVGSSQRFGIPVGYGGPYAAYFATRDEYKRSIPGRIIGVTVDAQGNRALRMALQTREQHIKRERATSNICTAQALPAIMAGMYAVYHGPEGIQKTALRIHQLAGALAGQLAGLGYEPNCRNFFDTLTIKIDPSGIPPVMEAAKAKEINFRYTAGHIGISLDETTTPDDVRDIAGVFAEAAGKQPVKFVVPENPAILIDDALLRRDDYMKQSVFHKYRSETEMMRYIKKLERRDISLTHSMIPLGSCTMKLNAAAEMFALSWGQFGNIHPFVPSDQAEGYGRLIGELSHSLAVITGLEAVSFQPASGASGEYAGMMVIRAYHSDRGESCRNTVLIPSSAHGTNPASAAMAGLNIVTVPCDSHGNVDTARLEELAEAEKEHLCAIMITYPSTHGVFEEGIRKAIDIVHRCGGQVYMDGANMNAQAGLTSPGFLGADVCHLNLHKTFASPHGGGGPGMGPICVAAHLAPFLPKHPVVRTGGEKSITAVGAAPWGSASILPISHAYISMMGENGLREASCMAILNANYLAAGLRKNFKILYTNSNGMVAHEFILDMNPFKPSGIVAADVAKRLMDYGFHAPTLSFPVANTLMIEPTESESLQELDRFIEAMESIHGEIQEIMAGKADKSNNVLKNAPHTEQAVVSDKWEYPYSREKAAYPLPWIRGNKFWPASGRVDDAYGDRNLQCSIVEN
jgi:glycine dehydrogenase